MLLGTPDFIFPRLVFMVTRFENQRRNLLKSSCTGDGAAAAISVGGSLNGFAAGGAMPLPQAHPIVDAPLLTFYRVSATTIRAEVTDDTVKGEAANSAVRTHLGCTLSNWDAPTKQFPFPCENAPFDPLKTGANTGGAASRMLPPIPFQAVNG